ncbi:MAG: phosphate ABC transporter substrate-binding protein [Proteobacteria bacterium]|nr:phosphate ABC transporter substrate-binding protein [Pseudomonadota bacterium]
MNLHTQNHTTQIKLALVALTALLTLSSGFVYAKGTLVWMGCGISKKAYMGKMAKAYTEQTGIKFRMAGGGATKGIRLTKSGKADIGGSCRFALLQPDGRPEKNEDVRMIHVAWDALVVVVNKDNPVSNISSSQLEDIFQGNIVNWQEVGGPNRPIKLLVREGTISGVGRLFRQLVLKDQDFEYPVSAAFFASSGPLERNLEKRKSLSAGIAITGISSAKKTALKVLSIDGVAPSPDNIARGKYPLFRPLYLSVNYDADIESLKFLLFVLSDEGQQIIAEQGTVNKKQGKLLEQLWLNKNLPL